MYTKIPLRVDPDTDEILSYRIQHPSGFIGYPRVRYEEYIRPEGITLLDEMDLIDKHVPAFSRDAWNPDQPNDPELWNPYVYNNVYLRNAGVRDRYRGLSSVPVSNVMNVITEVDDVFVPIGTSADPSNVYRCINQNANVIKGFVRSQLTRRRLLQHKNQTKVEVDERRCRSNIISR